MPLFDDYEADAAFERDYPFGVPCDVWRSARRDIRVKDMTTEHILNCMRLVGEDDAWYGYFAKELSRRKGEGE